MIPVFDAHCDTLFELEHMRLPIGSLGKNCLHVDLERFGKYNPAAQFFAIWGNRQTVPNYDVFSRLYTRFEAEIAASSKVVFCRSAAEAAKAVEKNRLAAFLSVEGAELLDEGERLEEAWEKGVRMITLTWNNANGISGSNAEECERGLTPKGREFIRKCQKFGIIIDLSHISKPRFWDTLEMAERPVIASHSCASSVCNHRRNLSDGQIRAIRDAGGVVGLNLYTHFLGGNSLDNCLRHIEHILDVGGEKTLALGGDLDGCSELPAGFEGVESWSIIYNELVSRGYSEQLLGDIFYNNMMRVVRNICDI